MAIYVYSGQVSSGISLTDDNMCVLYGGTALDTSVESDHCLNVSGVASETDVSQGSMFVYSAGKADGTQINLGRMWVFSGAVVNWTIVSSGGTVFISGIATPTAATILSLFSCRMKKVSARL